MKSTYWIKRENEILKSLLKNGFFWMNFSATDCDGCFRQTSIKFNSLEEFYDDEERTSDGAEGSFSYTLANQHPDGTFDLSEDFAGGQWES